MLIYREVSVTLKHESFLWCNFLTVHFFLEILNFETISRKSESCLFISITDISLCLVLFLLHFLNLL